MPFPRHTLETAPEASRGAMTSVQAKFGGIPVPVAKMATSPYLLNGFLQASAAFEQTSLPALAREVVVMTVAVRNGCQTCVTMHGAALDRLGRPDVAAQLRDDAGLPDPELEAIRVFVHRVIDHAGEVPQDELAAFLAAGYTAENALEVVFGIGVYTMSTFANRLLRA